MNRTKEYTMQASSDLEEVLNELKGSFVKAEKQERLSIVLDYHHNLQIYKVVATETDYKMAREWLTNVEEVFELGLKGYANDGSD